MYDLEEGSGAEIKAGDKIVVGVGLWGYAGQQRVVLGFITWMSQGGDTGHTVLYCFITRPLCHCARDE